MVNIMWWYLSLLLGGGLVSEICFFSAMVLTADSFLYSNLSHKSDLLVKDLSRPGDIC